MVPSGTWKLFCNYLLLVSGVYVSCISFFLPRIWFHMGGDHVRISALWEEFLCNFHCNLININKQFVWSYSHKNNNYLVVVCLMLRRIYIGKKNTLTTKSHRLITNFLPKDCLSVISRILSLRKKKLTIFFTCELIKFGLIIWEKIR
jgi:hypothetical protein